MSALAKPFIHPTLTIGGGGDMINIENVKNISEVTVTRPDIDDVFAIEFSFGMDLPSVSWKYATSALRDADLADIKTLVSNAIT